MNRIDEEGIRRGLTELREVKLTAAEKQNIRERLMAKIAAEPVRSPYSAPTYVAFRWVRMRKTVAIGIAALLVVVLSGGSAALAAEEALPGDFLYPMKVYFNEPIRSAAALGAKAEAEWEARRVERRLEEAQVLAAEGRFDEESRTILEMHFDKSAERFSLAIEEIKAEDEGAAQDFQVGFEARLAAHGRVLGHIEEFAEDSRKAEIALIRTRVEERSGRSFGAATIAAKAVPEAAMMLMQAADVSIETADAPVTDAVENISSRSRYDADRIEGLLNETEERLRRVRKVENAVQNALFDHTEDKIEEARRLLRQARGEGDGAASIIGDALRDARRAIEEADVYLDRGSELGGSRTRDYGRQEEDEGEDDAIIGEVRGVARDLEEAVGGAAEEDADDSSVTVSESESSSTDDEEDRAADDEEGGGGQDGSSGSEAEDPEDGGGGTIDSVIESTTGIKLKTGL